VVGVDQVIARLESRHEVGADRRAGPRGPAALAEAEHLGVRDEHEAAVDAKAPCCRERDNDDLTGGRRAVDSPGEPGSDAIVIHQFDEAEGLLGSDDHRAPLARPRARLLRKHAELPGEGCSRRQR